MPADDVFVASIRLVLAVARRRRFRVALIGGFALPFHGVQRATGDVDFLADAEGGGALHEALVAAGARCLHRTADAANYAGTRAKLAPLDLIFARRPRARATLERATPRLLRGARLRVPVVDAESVMGLKLQALANEPGRMQDEADIRALIAARGSRLNGGLLRDCLRLFDRAPALRMHDATRTPDVVKRTRNPIVGRRVRSQAILRPPVPVRNLDQFLLFLRRMHALFGARDRRPRQPTTGDRFLLRRGSGRGSRCPVPGATLPPCPEAIPACARSSPASTRRGRRSRPRSRTTSPRCAT